MTQTVVPNSVKSDIPALTWLERAIDKAKSASPEALLKVTLVCSDAEFKLRSEELCTGDLAWQKRRIDRDGIRVSTIATSSGPHILVNLAPVATEAAGMLEWNNEYSCARDLMGEVFALFAEHDASLVEMTYGACSESSIVGSLVGLELAAYDFRAWSGDQEEEKAVPGLVLRIAGNPDFPAHLVSRAIAQGQAVNVARHLVNLPAGKLDPVSYSDFVVDLFKDVATIDVSVWDEKRLENENMGLMLAVGRAAAKPPRLIHIKYRKGDPAGGPVAFVGKGITFDTGGLDIKPSAFMRTMKKDMGGSAALVGLAVWLEKINCACAVDIWLAVAENAVGKDAFRPGDILVSRNGRTVEIDNTDAEGRLVLADALTVATREEAGVKPVAVIDVATLTGAARVALGLQVGALFSTDRKLSDDLYHAGIESGDPLWPLPLVAAYRNELNSPVASLVNSSASRFGGAITAAMFLAEFVDGVPWAHIDINAYANETKGAITGPGANGQMVQCLIRFMEDRNQC